MLLAMPDQSCVVHRVREAAAAGDHERIVQLLVEWPLDFWFGLPPGETHRVLAAVPQKYFAYDPVASMMFSFFAPTSVTEPARPQAIAAMTEDPSLRDLLVFAQAGQARVKGDAAKSFELMSQLSDATQPVPVLIDSTRGRHMFVTAQIALTALLAGHYTDALAYYEKVLLSAPPAGLEFFTREARLRSGLIHGLWGDYKIAHHHLASARRVLRSASWVEEILDVEESILTALLESDTGEMVGLAETFQIEKIGETWPLFVLASLRQSWAVDAHGSARGRLRRLQELGVGAGATGLQGSAIPLTLAADALVSGHVPRVFEALKQADDRLPETRLLWAVGELCRGAYDRGLQLARSTVEQTKGLAFLDCMRISISALACLLLGDERQTTMILAQVRDRFGFDGATRVLWTSPRLERYAAEHLEGWPEVQIDPRSRYGFPAIENPESALTEREYDVLAALVQGKTREEVAKALFVSVNTVKTHQRSLYRKLGVGNVTEATLKGKQLGLL